MTVSRVACPDWIAVENPAGMTSAASAVPASTWERASSSDATRLIVATFAPSRPANGPSTSALPIEPPSRSTTA